MRRKVVISIPFPYILFRVTNGLPALFCRSTRVIALRSRTFPQELWSTHSSLTLLSNSSTLTRTLPFRYEIVWKANRDLEKSHHLPTRHGSSMAIMFLSILKIDYFPTIPRSPISWWKWKKRLISAQNIKAHRECPHYCKIRNAMNMSAIY